MKKLIIGFALICSAIPCFAGAPAKHFTTETIYTRELPPEIVPVEIIEEAEVKEEQKTTPFGFGVYGPYLTGIYKDTGFELEVGVYGEKTIMKGASTIYTLSGAEIKTGLSLFFGPGVSNNGGLFLGAELPLNHKFSIGADLYAMGNNLGQCFLSLRHYI